VGRGTVASLLLPVLFLVYWGAAALIVDAAAGVTGHGGRWRRYLAVSGFTFIPWVAYSLLAVLEALLGVTSVAGSAIAWLTFPLLAWFLYLTVLGRVLGVRGHAIRGGRAGDAARCGAALHPDRAARRDQPLNGRRNAWHTCMAQARRDSREHRARLPRARGPAHHQRLARSHDHVRRSGTGIPWDRCGGSPGCRMRSATGSTRCSRISSISRPAPTFSGAIRPRWWWPCSGPSPRFSARSSRTTW
jgi:hypothetical protein